MPLVDAGQPMFSTQHTSLGRCVARLLTTLPVLPRALSQDHNAEDEMEKRRIISSGGRVARLRINGRDEGPLRIWMATRDLPGLSMTRALGDQMGHSIGVIAEPEVTMHEIQPEDRYIIVCSDGGLHSRGLSSSRLALLTFATSGYMFHGAAGIVEFIENSEVMDMVHRLASSGAPPHIVAAQLIEEANLRWQEREGGIADDCTVVVVYLQTRISAGDQGVATPPLHTPRRASLPTAMGPGRSTSLPTLYAQPSRQEPGSVRTPWSVLGGSRRSTASTAAALPHVPSAAPGPVAAASEKRVSRGDESSAPKSRNPLAFLSRLGSKKGGSTSSSTGEVAAAAAAAADNGAGGGIHSRPSGGEQVTSASSPPPPPPPAAGGLPSVLRRDMSWSFVADQSNGPPASGLPARNPPVQRQAAKQAGRVVRTRFLFSRARDPQQQTLDRPAELFFTHAGCRTSAVRSATGRCSPTARPRPWLDPGAAAAGATRLRCRWVTSGPVQRRLSPALPQSLSSFVRVEPPAA